MGVWFVQLIMLGNAVTSIDRGELGIAVMFICFSAFAVVLEPILDGMDKLK